MIFGAIGADCRHQERVKEGGKKVNTSKDNTRLEMILNFIIAMTGIIGGTAAFIAFLLLMSAH